MLQQKTTGIDLKSKVYFSHSCLIIQKGLANEYWANNLFTTIGFPSQTTTRQRYSTIPWQLPDQNILLFRSVPVYDVCSDHLPPESKGYRNVFTSHAKQTLSLRISWQHGSCQFGQGQRESRLANLCRLCSGVDCQSQKALCPRRLWPSFKADHLCLRFDNHRLMFDIISMGKVSQTQSRHKTAYSHGPERLYPLLYQHYRRQNARCQYSRSTSAGTGCFLYNGSRLRRFFSPLSLQSTTGFLHHTSQKQYELFSTRVPRGGQNHRIAKRSNHFIASAKKLTRLSDPSTPSFILRYRDSKKIRVLNQQFYLRRIDNHAALQMPLASRTFLQMDQAKPSDKNFFRHFRERRKNSNMDSHLHVYACGDHKERTQHRTQFERNFANSQHYAFRESSFVSSTYGKLDAKPKCRVS